jgi:hypothetical protein
VIFPKRIYDKGKNEMLKNPFHLLVETTQGDHCCFFQGLIPSRWMFDVSLEFFRAIQASVSEFENAESY